MRNAVGSPIAGIDPMEIVNTIPVCNDLTEYVIDFGRMNERIANLPRKWNVCVVGSHDLYEHPHINDLAYMPAEKDGVFGYNLLVGGFFSATKCEEAISMDAFVPSDQVIHACDAILTTFRDFGARSGRQKCRMMWLIKVRPSHSSLSLFFLLTASKFPQNFRRTWAWRTSGTRWKTGCQGKSC